MVSFILVRHGESKDNLRQVWAGWRDAPLSNHGMRQAEALGDYFSQKNISFDAIYTSDLLRARYTAKAVQERQSTADIPIYESLLLREQNFGAGEGMKFSKKEKDLSLVAHYAKGKFPALHTRHHKFPGGENLDELAERAESVMTDLLHPEIAKEVSEGKPRTVAVFSHGLFIPELVAAMLRRDSAQVNNANVRDLRGMHNTGWTRCEVTAKESEMTATLPEGQLARTLPNTAISVRVVGIDRHTHLSNLHRQKGGIGSMSHDPAQQDIRAFLGGKQTSNPPVSASTGGKTTFTKNNPTGRPKTC